MHFCELIGFRQHLLPKAVVEERPLTALPTPYEWRTVMLKGAELKTFKKGDVIVSEGMGISFHELAVVSFHLRSRWNCALPTPPRRSLAQEWGGRFSCQRSL